MIERIDPQPVTKLAKLLGVSRSGIYYLPAPISAIDQQIIVRNDRLHLEFPFAGARMLLGLLRQEGFSNGSKRVARFMKCMGVEALYRKPRRTKPAPGHKIYPYLLRHLPVERANLVWVMDITYVPMAKGSIYLAAVVDRRTRCVLSWGLSVTMDTHFCLAAV